MWKFYPFACCFFCFLTIAYAECPEGPENLCCLEKVKALAYLEEAEKLLAKAGDPFPKCKADLKPKDQCSGEKPLACIEISRNLISDVRKKFLTCSRPPPTTTTTTTTTTTVPPTTTTTTTVKPTTTTTTTVKPTTTTTTTTVKPTTTTTTTVKPTTTTTTTTVPPTTTPTVPPTVSDDVLRNCSEILASGQKKSGVYSIWPRKPSNNGKEVKVYCDMDTDGGGWTMIQRRGKYPNQQDFYKDWETYKNGFGNIEQEFWLGNENIYDLCEKGCKIRFDMEAQNGLRSFAAYQSFNLTSSYVIHIEEYSGDAGDAMRYHNRYGFSTKDRGNTEKAKQLKGGWWYDYSSNYCHLNGVFKPGSNGVDCVNWYPFRQHENLASVEIKVGPK